ncbi:MAG TPA: LCCL domain-containing protein [Pyrinomonadaceae bacterium]|jgi:hypothetical protein
MKLCPKCGQTFNDDNLKFCLIDGEPLVANASEPTLVIPPTGPIVAAPTVAKKGSRPFLWIAIVALALIIGTVILVSVAVVSYRLGSERRSSNRPTSTNSTPTPVTRGSSSATPTLSVSPPPSDSPDVGEDEITPILWSTSASQLKTDIGRKYKFECPEGGAAASIWGSDIYTTDSSICSAAVHAGKITLEHGGQVTIEMRPGRNIYGSTNRNGITSNTYGAYPNSFVFP